MHKNFFYPRVCHIFTDCSTCFCIHAFVNHFNTVGADFNNAFPIFSEMLIIPFFTSGLYRSTYSTLAGDIIPANVKKRMFITFEYQKSPKTSMNNFNDNILFFFGHLIITGQAQTPGKDISPASSTSPAFM